MNSLGSHPEHRRPPWEIAEVIALGVLLTIAWRACGTRHQHKRLARSARAPREVRDWEGEGGRPLPAEHSASTVALATEKPKA